MLSMSQIDNCHKAQMMSKKWPRNKLELEDLNRKNQSTTMTMRTAITIMKRSIATATNTIVLTADVNILYILSILLLVIGNYNLILK